MKLYHETSNHGVCDKSIAEAAEMVRVCGHEARIDTWSDMFAGKILQVATITLGNYCGKLHIAYSSRSATNKAVRAILA